MLEEELKPAPTFSETAIAEDFAKQHSHILRFVAQFGLWMRYDNGVWREEKTRAAYNLSKELCKEYAAAVNVAKERKSLTSAKTISAVERIAMAERALAATVDQWDIDPWLLNTPDGVVDLRSGVLRQHSPDDYMTKITAVGLGKASSSPKRWIEHLKTVTEGDDDLIKYLQRWFGYCLTGSVKEHALLFSYGDGRTGKSTTFNTFAYILGNYAHAASMETFTYTPFPRHSTEIAALRGARFVHATETEEGRRWAEALIKKISAGDPVTARFMRQDDFTFIPQCKLNFQGNHQPHLRSVDESIRGRLNVCPFTAKIAELDKDLPEKLKEEGPDILRWALEGCLEWQQEKGLKPPARILKATSEYLESEDTKMTWFNDSFKHDNKSPGLFSEELFAHWKLWAERRGEYVGSMKTLSTWLNERSDKLKVRKAPNLFKKVKVTRGNVTVEEGKQAAGFTGLRFKEGAEAMADGGAM